MKRCLMLAAGLLAAAPLAAQGDPAAQLAGRVPPAVAEAAIALAESASTRQIPAEPIVQKALEGAAKHVPTDRIVAALSDVFDRLVTARQALVAAGVTAPVPEAIESGAFALNAGLDTAALAHIARAGGRSYAAATTLRVAGTLTALGVPAAGTVRLVSTALAAGVPVADVLDLPGRVESAVARGLTPAQAAEGLARAAQAQTGAITGRGRGRGGRPQVP